MPRSRLTLAGMLLALVPIGAEAKRIAILAGSDNYQHFHGLSLPGLERSLGELGALLDGRYGYSVQLLLGPEANHDRVLETVTTALEAANPEDEIIFVYSGHGQGLTPDAAKASYLVTQDCDKDHPLKTCLFQSVIADFSRSSRARSFLMVLDSCFSGALPGIIMGVPPELKATTGPARAPTMAPGFDRALALGRSREGLGSGSPGQVTWFDGITGRSFFMTALLTVLRAAPAAPSSCVFLQDLFSAIHDHVLKESRGIQEPLFYRSSASDVTGRFTLCLKGVEPQAMAAQAAPPAPPRPASLEKPLVAIIGSGEDYASYRLAALATTSSQLLDRQLYGDFRTMPITVGFQWEGEGFFRRMGVSPSVIVVHASALHASGELANRAVTKFQAMVRSWLSEMPHVKIVVFSRVPPPAPPPGLCARWERQTTFLLSKDLDSRVVFYPLARDESSFDGVAGIEMTRIVRCDAGLDAPGACGAFLREVEIKARDAATHSTCPETPERK
jgi:hypothetical protein